jgi:hypothetical protein
MQPSAMINKILTKLRKNRAFHREQREILAAAQQLFPGSIVSDGPFGGLRYAGWHGHGSAIYAKLLGTYEAELHPFVECVVSARPELVVDVGCAEGYYAIGLARRLPSAKIVAADSSERARQMCSEMARANAVTDRVEIMGVLHREGLLKLAAVPRGWLICDCEGGEVDLLDNQVLNKLSSWFLLVELHEYLVPGVEDRLIGLASCTHNVEVIDSVDDYRRARKWPRPAMEAMSSQITHAMYREGRPGLMRWLCATPRHDNN